MSQKHGQVWWTELMTGDVPGALKYYRAVCGWHFEAMQLQDGVYHVGSRGDRPVVGIRDIRGKSVEDMSGLLGMDEPPPHWFSYFAVDDLDRAVKETTERGGAVLRAPFDIPYVGRIAILADPTGAAIGLITPA